MILSAAMPWLAAGDPFGSLIALVIFAVIAALSNYLKRKRETGSDEDVPPLPGQAAPPRPPGRSRTWEEELQSLLEGEAPQEPPAAPPPVILVPREAPAPEPLPAAPPPPPPPVFARVEPSEETESHELHDLTAGHMASLREAEEAMHRASHLGETVRERVDAAELLARTAFAMPAVRRARERSPEIQAVIAQVRRPETARQAFLAGVILGPPRALAEW
jgi:colicin import membrane protein